MLLKQRYIYQRDGVFSPTVIDETAAKLKSYDDRNLSQRLHGQSPRGSGGGGTDGANHA